MDDESAEIELLEQNLNKTHLISQRITSILTGFDTRIAKLEKSILPLYNSAQILNRRAYNIDQILLKIDEVASNHEGTAAEEALILRGPQPGQIGAYQDTLERLNASIAFKSDSDILDTARLVETGTKKLAQVYTKLVAEASSGDIPPSTRLSTSSTVPILPTIPEAILAQLLPLVAFLRSLPQPATHPSHPAAPSILGTLKEAQKGYADMRGNWAKKYLEGYGKTVVERADSVDVIQAGQDIGSWAQALVAAAEHEYERLVALAPLPSSSTILSSYKTLLSPLLSLFESVIQSFISLVKRSLHRYSFLALSAYTSLSSLTPRFDGVLSRLSQEGRAKNELKDGLNALRSVCLRSFPEFLADIKLAAMGRAGTGELGTGLADMTISTVDYLTQLPAVQDAAGSALLSLGDGNWKMGEGVQVGGPKKEDSYGLDERSILEHFVSDLISTALSSLTNLSRTLKRSSTGSVFLLNNVYYLNRHLVLIYPPNPMLSSSTRESLQSSLRTAKAGYFEANFAPLMQSLSDDASSASSSGGGGKSKTSAKEKMTRFFDLLEEVLERHKIAGVLEEEGDEEEREQMGVEMGKMVGSALRVFVAKHREKEFAKNPTKYIKMTPEAVEQAIKKMYR